MINRFIFLLPAFLFSLSVRAQEIPVLVRILIDPYTDSTTVHFIGSNHPNVIYYKILWWHITSPTSTQLSGEPIPSTTVYETGQIEYSKTFFLEEVLHRPVCFSIDAYDSTGEAFCHSPPTDSSIYLSAVYDPCRASVTLRWNDYNAWRGNIRRYDIAGRTNAGAIPLGVLPEGINDTTIYDLEAGTNYLFYVIARRSPLNPNAYVTSNGVRFETTHGVYPEYIHADYGTVGEGDHPEVRFSIDSIAEPESYRLMRSADYNGTYDTIASPDPVNYEISYTDPDVNAAAQPWYYKLAAINSCNVAITLSENIAGTIHLNAILDNGSCHLNWTGYQNWPAGVESYTIERSLNESEFSELAQTVTTQYIDGSLNDLTNQSFGNRVCYRITAIEAPGDPHSTESASSTSNTQCINLPVNITFEYDAFVPGLDGFEGFGPSMDFLPSFFEFKIYNRSGSLVFESRDPENPRWDGRYRNGNFVPQGVYRYQLQYEDEPGNRQVIHGRVTVVRQ